MTGIQRFSYELCKMLIELGAEITILAPRKILPEYHLNCRIVQFGVFNNILWEQTDLRLYLLRHKNPLLINFGSPGPVFYSNRIVAIHDLSFLVHPSWFSKSYYLYYRWVTPIFIRRSKKVITVSEFSKQEILRLTGISENKIEIIYNAVSADLNGRQGANDVSRQPYILSVASLDPRKNTVRLVEAFKLSGLDAKYYLVLVGKKDTIFNMQILDEILANCVGYVSDEELASLYSNASLFVYPSIYEGFGIPPLEAMSLGCPVILSDIPVFREIFGDAACYADPGETESISDAMVHVLTHDDYRQQLYERGAERAKLYSWEQSARKLLAIINSSA